MTRQLRSPSAPLAGRARRPLARTAAALLALSLPLALIACEADTLYPDGAGPPPGQPPPAGTVGTIVRFPTGVTAAEIADLVVDPATGKVFLSNRAAHQVEVLDVAGMAFDPAIRVGSQPWGLALNRTGDTLMVANSGGSNVSFVPTATLREDVARRFDIPRVTLYDLNVQEDTATGGITVELGFHNYADRPHFLAQDAQGRLLYSVVPTQAAPVGTIRTAQWRPGWRTWDASLLFPEGLLASTPPVTNRAVTASDSLDFAIANVDSITLVFGTFGPFAGWTGDVVIYDHRPGSLPGEPGYLIRSDSLPPLDAIWQIYERGSDIIAYPGHQWNVPEAAEMADTTFVAVSGDRRRILFGELPAERAGRVVAWDATVGTLSRVEDIRDLLNNTSDRITGVDLNLNGSLGIARGQRGSYFFGPDLRLQGSTSHASGRGAGLLPNSSGARTLAFVGTQQGTIQVLETTHYRSVGEVPVGAPVVGPLRVAPAPTAEACPVSDYRQGEPDCVVARVYGVTADGVLIVDILRRHLE